MQELWCTGIDRTDDTMKPVTCLRSPKVSTWRNASSVSDSGSDSIE